MLSQRAVTRCVGAPIQRDILEWRMLSPAPEGQEEKQVLGTSEVQQGPLQGTGTAMWNCRGGGELSVPLLWGTLGGEVRGLLTSGFRQPLLIYIPSAMGTVGAMKAWFLSTHHPQEALAQLLCHHRLWDRAWHGAVHWPWGVVSPQRQGPQCFGSGHSTWAAEADTAWSLTFPVCLVGVPGGPTYPLGRCFERQECL